MAGMSYQTVMPIIGKQVMVKRLNIFMQCGLRQLIYLMMLTRVTM